MAGAEQQPVASTSKTSETPLQLLGLDTSQRAAYVQYRQLQLLRETVLRQNAEAIQYASNPSARSSPDSLSSDVLPPARKYNISGAHALNPDTDLDFDARAPLTVGWMPFEAKRLQTLFQPQDAYYDPNNLTRRQLDLLAQELAESDGPDVAAFKSCVERILDAL